MSIDAGLLECTFIVPTNEEAHFNKILANTDRDNSNCYGLSWLDDISEDYTAKSDRVGHESVFDTLRFLEKLLEEIPNIFVEGTIEHSFLISEGPNTSVVFWSENGKLIWDEKYRCEYCRERFADADLFGEGPFYCKSCGIEEGLEDGEEYLE